MLCHCACVIWLDITFFPSWKRKVMAYQIISINNNSMLRGLVLYMSQQTYSHLQWCPWCLQRTASSPVHCHQICRFHHGEWRAWCQQCGHQLREVCVSGPRRPCMTVRRQRIQNLWTVWSEGLSWRWHQRSRHTVRSETSGSRRMCGNPDHQWRACIDARVPAV